MSINLTNFTTKENKSLEASKSYNINTFLAPLTFQGCETANSHAVFDRVIDNSKVVVARFQDYSGRAIYLTRDQVSAMVLNQVPDTFSGEQGYTSRIMSLLRR